MPDRQNNSTPQSPLVASRVISSAVSPGTYDVITSTPQQSLLAKAEKLTRVSPVLAGRVKKTINLIYYTVLQRRGDAEGVGVLQAIVGETKTGMPTKGKFHHEKGFDILRNIIKTLDALNRTKSSDKNLVTEMSDYLEMQRKTFIDVLQHVPAERRKDFQQKGSLPTASPMTDRQKNMKRLHGDEEAENKTPNKLTKRSLESRKESQKIDKSIQAIKNGAKPPAPFTPPPKLSSYKFALLSDKANRAQQEEVEPKRLFTLK